MYEEFRKFAVEDAAVGSRFATNLHSLKGSFSPPGNDMYGVKCNAGSLFENYFIKF